MQTPKDESGGGGGCGGGGGGGGGVLSMLASTITYPLVEYEFDLVGESEYTNP